MSDKQLCKCGREDLTGVAVRHIGGGGWHTKESCELPTPPVPSEDADIFDKFADEIYERCEFLKPTGGMSKKDMAFVARQWFAAHVASRAAQEIDFDSLPDNMRSNQLQADGSYALPPRAAQPDTRKLAEKIDVNSAEYYLLTDGWKKDSCGWWISPYGYHIAEAVALHKERILLDGGKQ